MTLPADIPTADIVCTFVASDGGEVKGNVTLRYDGYFISSVYDTIVVPKAFTETLVNSTATITVPKDVATITYRVEEDFDNPVRRRVYFIDVNPGDTTIILADRAPVLPIQSGTAYATAAQLAGKQDKSTLGADVAADATVRGAFSPYPVGMEIAFAEVRTGLNATTTSVNAAQDLAGFGLQIDVEPTGRPVEVRGCAAFGHTVSGGGVGLRIIEVANGVDAPITRIDYKATGGAASPYYALCEPRLRVPPTPRTRSFKLQWVNLVAGTATLYTAGFDGSTFVSSANLNLYIQAVTL
jgi:hypothetical protein